MDHPLESTRPVDFDNPPLTEVTFSVQFDEDVADELLALSKFAPRIHDRYPVLEKQPPIPKASESFEVPPALPQPQIQFLTGPPTSRYWFISANSTQVVQVQADRLLFNWRQVRGDETYPHFDVLYPEFKGIVRTFLQVVNEDRGISPSPAWCELAYSNSIEAEGTTHGAHGQLARILNYLEVDPIREALPPVEDTQVQQRFRITDEDTGEPTGRLYVTAVPGYRNVDRAPVYGLTLLARGKAPEGEMPDSLDGFFEYAHLLIVKGFMEVTRPEMHTLWGERGS